MAQRNVSRRLKVYAWLSVLLFAGLGVWLLDSSWREHELMVHGKTVVAVADDFHRGLKSEYLLRYHFQLGADQPIHVVAMGPEEPTCWLRFGGRPGIRRRKPERSVSCTM